MTRPAGAKCAVRDCPNRRGQGHFVGALCAPCAAEDYRAWKDRAVAAEAREVQLREVQLREVLKDAAEEICVLKCGQEQASHEIGKGIIELGMDDNDLHLKNHGYINKALSLPEPPMLAEVAELRARVDELKICARTLLEFERQSKVLCTEWKIRAEQAEAKLAESEERHAEDAAAIDRLRDEVVELRGQKEAYIKIIAGLEANLVAFEKGPRDAKIIRALKWADLHDKHPTKGGPNTDECEMLAVLTAAYRASQARLAAALERATGHDAQVRAAFREAANEGNCRREHGGTWEDFEAWLKARAAEYPDTRTAEQIIADKDSRGGQGEAKNA